ncbi:MAG: aspartyl protease family protein [Burkholderiaceae bacterium]|nr:aspartyl protease family protein [Burkholderiaceae bacterium]
MRLSRRRVLQWPLAACVLPAHAAGATLPLGLLRTGDLGGLPWVEIELQGRATRWLVDSGASAALVSPALAERLALRPLSPVRVAMAGGAQTLQRAVLPPLPGAGMGSDTPAFVLDLRQLLGATGAALDGALGAPWLGERRTRFDFASGRLQWAGPFAAPPAGAVTLPLRWEEGLPVVALALGERAADEFVFDTGNAGALLLFARRAESLLAGAPPLPETAVRELGGVVRARLARIDRLSAPGWVARQVPAALESGAAVRRGLHFDRLAGSLGVALFEPGAVTLDGPGKRLVIELPGLPEPPALPGGFGMRLEAGSSLTVSAVFETGPAAAAGLAAGDQVQAIDGVDARQWSVPQAWAALAGRESCTLQVYRQGASHRAELRRERFFPLLR